MPLLADFQFFNTKRLTELYEKEHTHEQHKALMSQKEANLKQQVCVGGVFAWVCVCWWGGGLVVVRLV